MGVNSVIRGTAQVFERGGWQGRLRLSGSEVGRAMSDDEAAWLSTSVDLQALRDYRDAVGIETRAG